MAGVVIELIGMTSGSKEVRDVKRNRYKSSQTHARSLVMLIMDHPCLDFFKAFL